MKPLRILITGATGQVGGHLLWSLWREGHEVTALVRAPWVDKWAIQLRLLRETFGEITGDASEPCAVKGDLWEPLAGMTSEWIDGHRGQFDVVIHAAADTRFEPSHGEEQRRTNVGGALAMMSLAESLRVPRLFHLSTLFTSGAHPDPYRERDLFRGQRFRCHYERSKFEAETHLHRRAMTSDVQVTILRPGIVVGDSESGATLRYPHLYGFLSTLQHFQRRHRPGDRLCLPCDPATALPLICVNQISDFVMGLLAESKHREDDIDTWHLMARGGVTLGDLCQHLVQGGQDGVIAFDPTIAWESVRPLPGARPLWAWAQAHRPYLTSPGHFSAERTWEKFAAMDITVPEISAKTLLRIRESQSERVALETAR